jgi:hypothetical protein
MSGVLDLVDAGAAGPATRRSGVPVHEIIRVLQSGTSPAKAVSMLGLDPAELVAALAHEALGPEGSEGLPLVQGAPRHDWTAGALEERAWIELLPSTSRPVRLALAAGLLQVFDAWDASHQAAQQADDLGERAFSAYWHGIAHRREPDSGNASYWFRRVGRHALFPTLGERARRIATAEGNPGVGDRLAPGDVWNPFAFIDFCAEGHPAGGVAPLARKLQRLEMVVLLQATADAAGLA